MKITGSPPPPFPTIEKCSSDHRKNDAVAADLDGTLLRGRSSFPYFALVAYDTGGPLRLLLLLLLSPLAAFLYHLVSEASGIRVLIFAALSGARLSCIESAARAVLPKFYAEDVHSETWRVFSACGGRRCVVTANPRIMVEAFCKDYLGADVVMATELGSCMGRATGLVSPPGVLVGVNKASALERVFADSQLPDIGLGDRSSDFPLMKLCKVFLDPGTVSSLGVA